MFHLVWICHEFLGRTFSCTSSSAGWRCNIPCLLASSRNGVREVVLSLWRAPKLKSPSCTWWIPDSTLFLYARSARTCNRRCQCSSMINILCFDVHVCLVHHHRFTILVMNSGFLNSFTKYFIINVERVAFMIYLRVVFCCSCVSNRSPCSILSLLNIKTLAVFRLTCLIYNCFNRSP